MTTTTIAIILYEYHQGNQCRKRKMAMLTAYSRIASILKKATKRKIL